MQVEDKKRFGMALLAMSEYYDKPLSQPTMELWWEQLREFDIDAVERAFRMHMNSDAGEFMPKTANVVKLIGGTVEDKAMRAWAVVDKSVRRLGAYSSVVFDDPTTMRVILDMGGWERLCGHKEVEMPFVAKEFATRYRGFAMQGGAKEFPRKLAGSFERENGMNGLPSEAPVLIGDAEKAKRVFQLGQAGAGITMQRMDDITTKLLTKGTTP